MTSSETEIWFVRHAEPTVHADIAPDLWPLTEGGRDAARDLGDHIRWPQVSFVAASREVKAQETAAILADVGHVPWRVFSGLEELAVPWFDRPKALETAFGRYLQNRSETGFEPWEKASARVIRAIHTILDPPRPKIPVVVTHGRILTVLFHTAFHLPISVADWTSLQFPDFCRFDCHAGQVISGFFARPRQ